MEPETRMLMAARAYSGGRAFTVHDAGRSPARVKVIRTGSLSDALRGVSFLTPAYCAGLRILRTVTSPLASVKVISSNGSRALAVPLLTSASEISYRSRALGFRAFDLVE